ncbi:Trp biosynthesis-associated membrane protein [Leucobacter sp. cx-328]|uniref:Trp biosynthesis-associated membrane protein n=1 Tax=unclassified Leucobacter TaxID=2621730 RepID=UPI00165DC63C|nr:MULTISPECIES: Trp biosynthesis-associated membrane protein [unclassified Leucobacter]MBC9944888.1 Trp biosynthesis-associated membrane protein [Leucobacter sp. cx-328]
MRNKWTLILAIAVLGGGSLIVGSQGWVQFDITQLGVDSEIGIGTVSGHNANPALSPVGVAALVAALVLAIAGSVFRRVLAVLIALLGAGIAYGGFSVLNDPIAAVRGTATELTGLSGDAVETVIVASTTVWPIVVIVAGVLIAILGIVALFVSGNWGAGDRKYASGAEKSRKPEVKKSAGPDRISDWDALSDGEDPTLSTP